MFRLETSNERKFNVYEYQFRRFTPCMLFGRGRYRFPLTPLRIKTPRLFGSEE